jgi:hypothetical protein
MPNSYPVRQVKLGQIKSGLDLTKTTNPAQSSLFDRQYLENLAYCFFVQYILKLPPPVLKR